MYNKLATVEKHMLCITYIHTYVHTDHLHRYCKWSNIARPHICLNLNLNHVASTFLPKNKQTWSDSCIFDPLSLFRVGLSVFLDWFQLGSEFHRFLFVFLALPHSFLCYPLNFGVFVFTKRKIIRKCMTSKQNKGIVEKKTPKSINPDWKFCIRTTEWRMLPQS